MKRHGAVRFEGRGRTGPRPNGGVLLIATLFVVAGCGAGEGSAGFVDLGLQPTSIDLEAEAYGEVAWIDDKQLAYLVELEPTIILSTAHDGQEPGRISVDPPPGCIDPIVTALHQLPSGGLGTGLSCVSSEPGVFDMTVLIALGTGASAPRELGRLAHRSRVITWQADRRALVYSSGSVLCQSLRSWHLGVDAPLDLVVGHGGRSFNLATMWGLGDCTSTGWADLPAFSPDGSELAFLASTSIIGVQSWDRAGVVAGLYVRDQTGAVRSILDEVVARAGGLVWTAGGRTLLFSGEIGGQAGLWSVRRDGTGLSRLTPVSFGWLALSPDGTTIGSIVPSPNPPPNGLGAGRPRAQLITLVLPDPDPR